MNSIDIFPWNENFNTGIAKIDEQHQKLVRLLNQLASHVAFQTDIPALNDIFDQLADYAVYHFQTEETIWHEYLADDALETTHKDVHDSFIATIHRLKAEENSLPVNAVAEDVLSYLARWLASHILENDRYMTLVVRNVQSGLSLADAKTLARHQLDGTMRALIDIILATYSSLTTNTLHLMRELAEHKRDSDFLRTLSLAVEQSANSIMITDLDANIEFVNETFVKTTGYSRAEVIGKNPRLLQSGQTPKETYDDLWATLNRGEVWKGEFINKRKDGGLYMEQALITPVCQPNGKRTHYLAIKEDITERKRTEQALKRECEKSLALLRNASDGIHILDSNGNIIEVSDAFCAMLGYRREEMIGMNVSQWDAKFSAAERTEKISRQFANPGRSQFETLHRRKDGSIFDVEVSGYALELDGRPVLFNSSRDITERKHTEKRLSDSENKYRSLIELAGDAIFIADTFTGKIIDCNKSASALIGKSKAEIIGLHQSELHPPDKAEQYQKLFKGHVETGNDIAEDLLVIHKDGHTIPVDIHATVIELEGAPVILGIFRDITARKTAEAEMRVAATAFESQQGMMITNADNAIVRVNQAFTGITGYSAEEVIGLNPGIINSGSHDRHFFKAMWESLHDTGSWEGEIWNKRKNGEIYPEYLSIKAVKNADGEITHYVSTHTDITQLKRHQFEVEHIAYHDPLTELPNRRLLADRMQQALSRAKRFNESICVVCIDLDGFKAVNDTLGHDAGDRLLIEAASRMVRCVRTDDTVARLGGDEFVLLLGGIGSRTICELTLHRVLEELVMPFNLGEGKTASISGSIGYTLYPEDDADADTLLRHADHAMYAAKQAGKNRFHLFDLRLDNRTKANWGALDRIDKGLDKAEFRLYIQPKIDLSNGQVAGAEALVRWLHPIRGLVPPIEFLPLIEDQNLSLKLGDWVIREGMRLLNGWQAQGLHIPLSVNVSARQLREKDFPTRLRAILKSYPDVPPQRLEIEIVESAALDDINKVSLLIGECRAHGVRFSLDDFGTGYSSLTYLKRLSVDTLKIDQTFVRDMLTDESALAIVRGVIGLAQAFGNHTVAEGVETWRHATKLKQLGCEMIQGYAVARPMPAEDMLDWVSKFRMPVI